MITTPSVNESVIRLMTRLAHQHGAINLSQGFPNEPPPAKVRLALAQAVLSGRVHSDDEGLRLSHATEQDLRDDLLDLLTTQSSASTATATAAVTTTTITDELNQYSPPMGREDARVAVSNYYQHLYQYDVSPNDITLTLGATEAVATALRTIGSPGDKVVIFEPFHELYPSQCGIFYLDPVYVTLHASSVEETGRWNYDYEELRGAIEDGKTKALILNTPHNPTGKVFTYEELESIVELCIRTGTGSYSPMGGPSTVGMPPVSYHRYDSYQSTYYPYGANGSTPYSSHVAMGSQAGYAASQMQMMAAGGGSYAGVGAGGPMYGGAAQAYTHYGSGYPPPQQFPAPAPYDYHELSSRGQTRHQANRSYATRPGRPYFRDKSRSGPNGANLFVFHVPNEMTNEDMLRLFQPHGNVLSVRIMTERHTGRGKGYGFVSYDSVEAAENAIHFLNGFEIQGKRLKVQHKESKKRDDDSHNQGHRSSPSFAPVQEHSRPSRHHQHHQGQSPAASGFVPAHESVPVPEYSTPSRHHHHHQGRSPAASGFVPAHESVPVQDHSIPSWHHQHHQGQSPAASGFVPVHESVPGQEYAGPSEPDHRHELAPVLPPIEDDSRHCRTPTLPSVDEPHHRRQPTPTLPPIDALGEGSNPPDYEGAQGYTTPQSPLADLKDIGKSLPDPK